MTLKRVLGPVDAAWLVAGNMIGAGIFFTPRLVAGHLPGAAWQLTAWVLGGLLALCGAAIYGELGARIPKAGGDYQYLTEALGTVWGFLTAWGAFLLTFSAAAAAMARVTVEYVQAAIPGKTGGGWTVPVGAALLVLALTAANVAGARVSGRTTMVLTGLPVAGLVGVFLFGVLTGEGRAEWPQHLLAPPAGSWAIGFGAAMLPVFFTYSGWNAAAYVAGEVRDPGRNLPRGLLLGTGLVMLLYVLLNVLLIFALPPSLLSGAEGRQETAVLADAARRLLGPAAERSLSLFVALAVLGSVNVTLMAGARIYYAVGLDRLGPPLLARTNRAGVPHVALWAGGIWSALLAATGTVGQLVNWATLAILLLSSATAVSLFVLRRRDRRDAGYLCPVYPLTPVVYLGATLAVAVAHTISEPVQSLKGLVLLALGLPLYVVARRFRSGAEETASGERG